MNLKIVKSPFNHIGIERKDGRLLIHLWRYSVSWKISSTDYYRRSFHLTNNLELLVFKDNETILKKLFISRILVSECSCEGLHVVRVNLTGNPVEIKSHILQVDSTYKRLGFKSFKRSLIISFNTPIDGQSRITIITKKYLSRDKLLNKFSKKKLKRLKSCYVIN